MNIFFFSSDYRSYSPLENVYRESISRDIPSFFLYTKSTSPISPIQNMDSYNYDSNIEDIENTIFIQSLGISLPFTPQILVISKERWQPEQSVIYELKNRFNTKIYVIETSTHLINNIENRIEMVSRAYNQPQSTCVDGFFEQSEFAKNRRIDCLSKEWGKKSIVVGNPRFDKLYNINKEKCIEKYNIRPDLPCILFWGVINTTRNESFELLKKLQKDQGKKYQIFYKPNPQEPFNPLFSHQFNPFFIEGVKVIYDDFDINPISKICNIHIGSISSIYNYAFYFNKKLVSIDNICRVDKHTNNYNNYLNETKNGVEDSAKFWMGVFGLKTHKELENLIELNRLEKFNETNKLVIKMVKDNLHTFDYEYKFLEEEKKDYKNIIKIFDEFNDKKASKRIIDFLEKV